MSYEPLRRQDYETPDEPWPRAEASNEVMRAAAELARELSDRLGWKVKVEVTARLGGQLASTAIRAVPVERD
jgi:hypothetical protein